MARNAAAHANSKTTDSAAKPRIRPRRLPLRSSKMADFAEGFWRRLKDIGNIVSGSARESDDHCMVRHHDEY